MNKITILTCGAAAALLALTALPVMAQDGYYQRETCYDRDQDAATGGALTGAVVGGVAAGPVGAVVGAAVGGSAGDDSVHCRYERDGYYAGNGDEYRDGYYYRRDYDQNHRDRDRDGYGSTYREGYGDGYSDASERFNGSDRGYRYNDTYYARRPSYHRGYYDGYGFWHPASDDGRSH